MKFRLVVGAVLVVLLGFALTANLLVQHYIAERLPVLLTSNVAVQLVDDRYDTKVTLDGPSLQGVWQFQTDKLFDLGAESKLDISHLEPTELEHVAAQ